MELKKKDIFSLFLISFITLFMELAMIRWLPGTVTVVSFFTNLVLISSFLGMGLGCAIAKKKSFVKYTPLLFYLLVMSAMALKSSSIGSTETLSDFIFIHPSPLTLPILVVVPFVFFVNFLFFVPLGQVLGSYFLKFKPLEAYSINIVGAVIGTLAFTGLALFSAPAVVWFLIGAIGILWFIGNKKMLVLGAVFFIISIATIAATSDGEIWSPYHKITVENLNPANFFELTVNNNYYMAATDFSENSVEQFELVMAWKEIYGLPYEFFQPKEVLVLGSGAGNDIYLALESGAQRVDAVEIDPIISKIAEEKRLDGIYSDPRVNVIVDDARSFIKKTNKKYDLIVYGFLDSHRLFSNMANVRLDNFVYTVEGIADAKKLIKPGGGVALSFCAAKPWISQKIYDMLKENFGDAPLAFKSDFLPTEQIFLSSLDGKINKKDIERFTEFSNELEENSGRFKVPTDDWPYFYLENNFIPTEYLAILILIFLASAAIVLALIRPLRNLLGNLHFFFLGAAFMLIETKSIIELSLVFGSSWIVSAIVITSILLMILAANIYILRLKPKNYLVFYILLLFALLLNVVVPPNSIFIVDPLFKLLICSLLVSLPIFFAALVFASLFRKTKETHLALGLNLLGGVLGGFLEYLSIVYGIQQLVLIAILCYLLVFIFARKSVN